MIPRDRYCTLYDVHVGERLESIVNDEGQLCYRKIQQLSSQDNVKFSNKTVGDLAYGYERVSKALKKTTARLAAQKDKLDAAAAVALYGPALLEVAETLFMNLPDVKSDIPLQDLNEASIALDKLQKLIAAFDFDGSEE